MKGRVTNRRSHISLYSLPVPWVVLSVFLLATLSHTPYPPHAPSLRLGLSLGLSPPSGSLPPPIPSTSPSSHRRSRPFGRSVVGPTPRADRVSEGSLRPNRVGEPVRRQTETADILVVSAHSFPVASVTSVRPRTRRLRLRVRSERGVEKGKETIRSLDTAGQ